MRPRSFAAGSIALATIMLCVPIFPASPAARVPWTSNRVVGSPQHPAPYTVARVLPRVSFEHPVDLAVMLGSDGPIVADQSSRLWSIHTRSPASRAELITDLRQFHQPLETILGFTFDPGFATNHFIFINYNEPAGRENGAHVSRFTLSSLT